MQDKKKLLLSRYFSAIKSTIITSGRHLQCGDELQQSSTTWPRDSDWL